MSFDWNKFWTVLTTNPNKGIDEKLKEELKYVDEKELNDEVQKLRDQETGTERVKKLFDNMLLNPEMAILNENVYRLFMVGFILGGVNHVASTTENFKRANQLTVYTDQRSATRSLGEYIFVATMKGGMKWGAKFAAFSALGLGLSSIITAYQYKSSPLTYVAGLGATGALFRMHHGLKNFIFGGVYGGLLGGIYGTGSYFMRKYSNTLYEDYRYKELALRAIEKMKMDKLVSDYQK